MSVCFTSTPGGASRAFVYSLLGDNEPHVTGVGRPVTLEPGEDEEDRGCVRDDTPDAQTVVESVVKSSPESSGNYENPTELAQEKIDSPPEESDDVKRDVELTTEASPIVESTEKEMHEPIVEPTASVFTETVTKNATVLVSEKVAISTDPLGEEDGSALKEPEVAERVELPMETSNDSRDPSTDMALQLGSEISGRSEVNSTDGSGSPVVSNEEVSKEHVEVNVVADPEVSPCEDGQLSEHDQSASWKSSDWPAIQVQIPDEPQNFPASAATSQELVDSPEVSLSPAAIHNVSSDSSDLFVTAANSEGCDSVPSTSGNSCPEEDEEEEDTPGWLHAATADVQPDSLEEEVGVGTSEQGGFFSVDRSLPIFVLAEGGPTSLGTRTPKKLFRDDDQEDVYDGHAAHNARPTEDVNLKDLEGRKLRELERERRRIIDNQAVRRKKFDYWAFANEDRPAPSSCASSGPASAPPDVALPHRSETGTRVRTNWPPTPPTSPVSRIPVATVLGRVSPGSLPRGWSPPSSVLRSVSPPVSAAPGPAARPKSPCSKARGSVVAAEDSPPVSPARTPSPSVYAPLPWTGGAQSSCFPDCRAGISPDHVQEEEEDQDQSLTSRLEAQGVDAGPLPDSVDCASILENKERLRLFWERRIMAEQENAVATTAGEVTAEPEAGSGNEAVSEVSPPDSLNEKSNPDKTGDVQHTSDTESGELAAEPPKQDSPLRESNRSDENEGQLKEDNSAREPNSEEHLERSEMVTSSVESEERKLDCADQPVEVSTKQGSTDENLPPFSAESEPANDKVVHDELAPVEGNTTENTCHSLVETEECTEETKQTPVENTATTDQQKNSEEEVVLSRPQVVGETYQITNGFSPEPLAAAPTLQSPLVSVQPAALPTPRAERPPFNPGADSKIAQEIQEMQAREEELRRMRERVQQQNGVKASSRLSDGGGSVHSDDGRGPCDRGSPAPPEDKNAGYVNGQLEGLRGQTVYSQGYAFGHRRKESVKVKPLFDETDFRRPDGEEQAPAFAVLEESPIEREIRLAREREEELRKEKGICSGSPGSVSGQQQRPTSLLLSDSGPWRGQANGGGKTVGPASTDTQRFLATTRIQQEIVEQTEREMALRASGMIQTISQERTDAKVTRLRDVTSPAEKRALLLLSSSPPTSPATSSSSASDSDKNGPGLITNGVTNGHHPKTPSPSSSLSGAQVTHEGTTNGVSRRLSNTPQVRGVSMQRFIASKGRELSFSTFGPKMQKSSSALSLNADPVGKVTTATAREGPRSLGSMGTVTASSGNLSSPKRCPTAETKIQDELKEMQAREDELRQQRARLLDLSQPNLSTLSGDEDLRVSNGHHSPTREVNNKQDAMNRAASNPNLLDDDEQYDDDDDDDEKISVGGPRRRSMLIDQWEKRILKKEVVKTT